MANELWHNYETGNTLYARIRRRSDAKVYDVDAGGDNFETWADGSVATYDLALTDRDGNFYSVDFPSGISAGVYDVGIFLQTDVAPLVTDDELAQGVVYWDGTAEVNDLTIDTKIDDDVIGADGDTLNDISDEIEALTSDVNSVLFIEDERIGKEQEKDVIV